MTAAMTTDRRFLLRASFDDVDEFCETARDWDIDFRPLADLDHSGAVAEILQANFGAVDFGSARLRLPLDQVGSPPAGRHTFVLLGKQTKQLYWRGQHVLHSDVLVFHEGSELSSLSGADFENFCLSVDESYVQAVAEREQIILPALRRRPEVFRPSPRLLAEARGVVIACRDGDPSMTESIVSEITDRLIMVWLMNAGLHRRMAETRRCETALRKSVDLIVAEPYGRVSVAELSAASGASRRTLEYAFTNHFGVGPAAFMKRLRMANVHRELARSVPDEVRVADLMVKYDFGHVGQFAADYCRQFGERPSETLQSRTTDCA